MAAQRFVRSAMTQRLVMRLRKAVLGEVISYEEITSTIGADVRSRRHVLDSARKILLTEDKRIFGAVRKVGVKWLTAEEVVDDGEQFVPRVRRMSVLQRKKLATVDLSALPDAKKARAHVVETIGGVVEALTAQTAQERIEGAVRTVNDALPSHEALKMLDEVAL